jgi:hypothetical protein
VRYLDSIRYVFNKDNWFVNTLLCVVCMLIPVIGQIVLLGYMYEVFDVLHRNRSDRSYPDFKFERFTEYLTRGVWPFLVQLLAQAVLLPLMFAAYFVAMMVTVAAAEKLKFLVVVAWLGYVAVAVVASVVIGLVMWPAQMHAGYGRQFNLGGMLSFVKEFFSKVGKELVFSLLFLFAAGFVLGAIGLIACCVGAWFAGVILTYSQFHLKDQLYELYLQRGGSPIPVKGEPSGPPAGDLSTAITVEPADRLDPPARD